MEDTAIFKFCSDMKERMSSSKPHTWRELAQIKNEVISYDDKDVRFRKISVVKTVEIRTSTSDRGARTATTLVYMVL